MFLWLKQGGEEQLQALREQGLVGDLRAETDRASGKKYIQTYTEVGDPTSEISKQLGELMERVTSRKRIDRGLRTNGVYRHDGATLVSETEIRVHSSGMMDEIILREEWQWINISGPSVEAVRTIYSLFRQGKLTPAENWEANAPVAPLATGPSFETTALTMPPLPS